MHTGRRSYTKLNLHDIACARRRRYVKWYARLYSAQPSWANVEKMKAIYRNARSRRNSGIDVQVDHIIPLFHPRVCGLHNEFNLCVITRKQNAAKSNHTWPDDPNETGDLFPETLGAIQYALPL